MTPESVDRLFKIVAPRYADRNGGYSRIVRTGVRKGDASEMAFIELLGAEQELSEKASKREEARPSAAKSCRSSSKRPTPATKTPSNPSPGDGNTQGASARARLLLL